MLTMHLTCGTQLSTTFLLLPPPVVEQRRWARRPARADPAAPPNVGGPHWPRRAAQLQRPSLARARRPTPAARVGPLRRRLGGRFEVRGAAAGEEEVVAKGVFFAREVGRGRRCRGRRAAPCWGRRRGGCRGAWPGARRGGKRRRRAGTGRTPTSAGLETITHVLNRGNFERQGRHLQVVVVMIVEQRVALRVGSVPATTKSSSSGRLAFAQAAIPQSTFNRSAKILAYSNQIHPTHLVSAQFLTPTVPDGRHLDPHRQSR